MITVQPAQYFSMFINESENTSASDRKMMHMFYVRKIALSNVKLLRLKEARWVNTEGLRNTVPNTVSELRVDVRTSTLA